jgi:hypothetical protein
MRQLAESSAADPLDCITVQLVTLPFGPTLRFTVTAPLSRATSAEAG